MRHVIKQRTLVQCGLFISHLRAKHTVNDSGEQFLTVFPYIFKVVPITVRFPATPIFQFRNCRLVRVGANEARNGSTERVAGKRVEIITKIPQQLFQLFIEHGFCQIFWWSESENRFLRVKNTFFDSQISKLGESCGWAWTRTRHRINVENLSVKTCGFTEWDKYKNLIFTPEFDVLP